jgi:hypothetical protein
MEIRKVNHEVMPGHSLRLAFGTAQIHLMPRQMALRVGGEISLRADQVIRLELTRDREGYEVLLDRRDVEGIIETAHEAGWRDPA